MPVYNKIDKINTLVALDLNDGNVSQTAKEFGVDRGTIYNWQKQLDKDVRLLAQVEAAKNNLANIEELTALKALGEINKRLDLSPEREKTQDLIKLKDSGINNSRLIRGQATSIVQNQAEMLQSLVNYCKLHAGDSKTLAAMVLYAEGSGVDRGLREAEAEKILREDNVSVP